MKNLRIFAIAMALCLGLATMVFAISKLTRTASAKTTASCCADASCCSGDSCKMGGSCCANHDKQNVAAKTEKSACCGDASCCADGKCKMGGSCCGGDSCSTKKATAKMQNASFNRVPMENASDDAASCHHNKTQASADGAKSDCCAGGGSACCTGGGSACCSKSKAKAATAKL